MEFTNSPLVTQVRLVKGKYNARRGLIEGITIHHNAGVATVAQLLEYANTTTRNMSFNYCINDYDIGMDVEEKNRAWTSSSAANDHRCVTIEVCNSSAGGDWPISDASMDTLIKLCADICKRNGIKKLFYDGTTNGTLTRHEMFASTGCPGPYIKAHTDYICDEVNKLIGESTPSEPVKPDTPVTPPVNDKKYEVVTVLKGYYTSADAVAGRNPVRSVEPGTYFVYNETAEAVNVTRTKSVPGAWIDKSKNIIVSNDDNPIGKEVIINGQLFGNSAGGHPGKTVSNVRTKITRYAKGAAKPYNTTGDLGWVAASSVTFVSGGTSNPVKPAEPAKPTKPVDTNPIGKTVIVSGQLFGNSAGGNPGKTVSNLRTKVTRYIKGAAKPYNFTGDIGWVAASSVKFIDGTTNTSSSSTRIAVGDKVRVKRGAKSYTGGSIKSWVYDKVYRVDELKGDRAVLDRDGLCTAFKVSDLIKQ